MRRFLVVAMIVPWALVAMPAAARNYDCSKPGNANKAVCKGKVATTPAKPAPTPTKAAVATPAKKAPAATTARNYDCSKAGNANKAVCKAAAPAAKVATAPASKPAATVAASRPAGAATGKCKDGTETRATTHRGACSHHGGVAAWY